MTSRQNKLLLRHVESAFAVLSNWLFLVRKPSSTRFRRNHDKYFNVYFERSHNSQSTGIWHAKTWHDIIWRALTERVSYDVIHEARIQPVQGSNNSLNYCMSFAYVRFTLLQVYMSSVITEGSIRFFFLRRIASDRVQYFRICYTHCLWVLGTI